MPNSLPELPACSPPPCGEGLGVGGTPPIVGTSTPTPTHIVALARTWLGTPYHHQASLRGVGCDCIGLVRGIYRELYGREAERVPGYTRDWAEASGIETLIEAGRRHLIEIAPADAQPGDVLVFRYRGGSVAKHVGILATADSMIHAMDGAAVCEVALSPWWRRRLAATFRFP
jgi:NlpC/P60 family putative phage cell wall peptidase